MRKFGRMKGFDAKGAKVATFRHGASGLAGDKAELEGGGGGEGLEGVVGGELGEEGGAIRIRRGWVSGRAWVKGMGFKA